MKGQHPPSIVLQRFDSPNLFPPALWDGQVVHNVYFYHWYIFFGMALWTPYVHIITPVAHILVLHNAGNPGFVRSQLFCNIWIWLLCCADIYTENIHHKNNENKLACFNKLWMFVKTKCLIFFVTECFVYITVFENFWRFLLNSEPVSLAKYIIIHYSLFIIRIQFGFCTV